jgi:hypothetical protein
VRPTLPPYRFASVPGEQDKFLETPNSIVVAAIVVEVAVRVDDLSSRIAGMWGSAEWDRESQ